MKVAKAIELVQSIYAINNNRLAVASGVGRATIGKLLRGEHQTITWDLLERLIKGFQTLHPEAKELFLYLLTLPDDYPKLFEALGCSDRLPANAYKKFARLTLTILLERKLLRKKETGKLLNALDPGGEENEALLLIDWLAQQIAERIEEEEDLPDWELHAELEAMKEKFAFSMLEEADPREEQSES